MCERDCSCPGDDTSGTSVLEGTAVGSAYETLDAALSCLEDADLGGLTPEQELEVVRRREVARRRLPLVAAAYGRGEIPTAYVRAVARTVSNPRVAEHVPGADPIFAEAAVRLFYDDFSAVLREWESYADVDGTDQAAEKTHERRQASLVQNVIDGSWHLEGTFGAVQGAATTARG